MLKIDAFGKTDKGLNRHKNEDSFHVDVNNGIFIVCDGVGGNKAGEVASSKAVQLLSSMLLKEKQFLADSRNGVFDDQEIFNFIAEIAANVCSEIHRLSSENPEYSKMSTTMTMAVSLGNRVLIAHVGDSRAYSLNAFGVHQLTEDHTLVADFIRKGLIADESTAAPYIKNILTRALGKEATVDIDSLIIAVEPGDRLVLCSDGVSNCLKQASDLASIVQGDDSSAQADALLNYAIKQCGDDNATVVVINFLAAGSQESTEEAACEASLLESLGKSPLFKNLNFRQLSRLRSYMQIVYLEKDDELVAAGEKYTGFYLVLEGGIISSDELLLAGEFFGLSSLYRDSYSKTRKIAVKPSQVLCFDRNNFKIFAQRHPLITSRIYLNTIDYLLETKNQTSGQ